MAHNFSEDSRVKIPAILHLTRLGYTFLPNSKIVNVHPETNIFLDVFKESISKINGKAYSSAKINEFITEINTQLENNDLGKVFYESLQGNFSCKLIDFENFENNTFNVVTELTCKNGEDEFPACQACRCKPGNNRPKKWGNGFDKLSPGKTTGQPVVSYNIG